MFLEPAGPKLDNAWGGGGGGGGEGGDQTCTYFVKFGIWVSFGMHHRWVKGHNATKKFLYFETAYNVQLTHHFIQLFVIWCLMCKLNSSEYSSLFDQYHACWCPGFLSCQGISRNSIVWATCSVAPLWIWSPNVEQNSRYDMKYEHIF